MEFVKFWKEYKRMCDNGDFPRCPFKSEMESCWGCDEFMSNYPEKAERIVEQWAKEHPVMTNGEKFTEIFGKHAFCQSGFQFTIHAPDMGNTFKTFGEWLKQEYQPPKGEEG